MAANALTRDTPIDDQEMIPVAIVDAAIAQQVADTVKLADDWEAAGKLPPGTADAILADVGVSRDTLAAAMKTVEEAPVETRQRVRRVARDGFEAAVAASRSRRFPTSTATRSMPRRRTRRFDPRPRESRAGRGGFARSLSPPAEDDPEHDLVARALA